MVLLAWAADAFARTAADEFGVYLVVLLAGAAGLWYVLEPLTRLTDRLLSGPSMPRAQN